MKSFFVSNLGLCFLIALATANTSTSASNVEAPTFTSSANQSISNTGVQPIFSDDDLAQAKYYRQNREDVTIRITTSDNQTVNFGSPFMQMELHDGTSLCSFCSSSCYLGYSEAYYG
jgi:hypothetical protein